MVRTVIRMLVLATSCASPLACKGDETKTQLDELAHKVTADSQSDAAAPIVDEDLRFRLEWPGAGWKMLGRDDARRLVPDSFAGALHPPDVFASVIVERIPGLTADALVDLSLDALPLRDLVVDERTPMQIAGVDAVRVVFQGNLDGTHYRYANILFTHRDHGYQLLGWGAGNFDVARLDPLWRGFSLLDGEVHMPARDVVREARGPGWRISDGVFASAVSGLRIEPRGNWTLVTGQELTLMHDDAEIGLSTPDGAYAFVISERIGKTTPEAYRAAKRARMTDTAGALENDAWKVDMLGASTTFDVARMGGMEMLLGTRLEHGIGFQIVGYYPESLRETARDELAVGFAGFDLLAPDARKVLHDELTAVPDVTHEIGSDYAIHRGTFRDFANGLTWTSTPGLWKPRGPRGNDDAHLRLATDELDRSVHLELYVQPIETRDGETWFRERATPFTDAPPKPARMMVGELELHVGDLRLGENGIAIDGVLATAIHRGQGVSLLLLGATGGLTRTSPWVEEVLRGLALDHEGSAVRVADGHYEDLRLGVALDAPKGSSHTVKEEHSAASHHVFHKGGHVMHVFGVGHGGTAVDATFAAQTAERAMRALVTADLGAATDHSRKVGDLDVLWHSWSTPLRPRMDSLVTTIPDGTLVIVMESFEEAEVEALVGSIRLL